MLAASVASGQPDLDVILAGGRVMDPESQLDAIRNVGIREDSIVAISELSLASRLRPGGSRIDVKGLVVAPGFIDLHAHGQSDDAFRYRVHDGVTTALELEWGYPRISEWVASRAGGARIHYGASASHAMLRALAMTDRENFQSAIDQFNTAAVAAEPLRFFQRLPVVTAGRYQELPERAISGTMVIRDGKLVEGQFPGKPLLGRVGNRESESTQR